MVEQLGIAIQVFRLIEEYKERMSNDGGSVIDESEDDANGELRLEATQESKRYTQQ